MADELLEALAQHQRETDAKDPPIPLDDFDGEAGDALLDDMFAELDAKAAIAAAPSIAAQPPNVTELPQRRSTVWVAAAVALAAAAALVLWFAVRAPVVDALPTYNAIEIAGGPAAIRGDHDAVASQLELRGPDDNIDWKFSAASSVEQSVAVSLLATSKDGQVVFAKAVDANLKASGSARLRGPLDGFIDLPPGQWTVEVVFSHASEAPSSPDEVRDSHWQRLPIEVIILPS
ncbi:MAG: hypothetical protein ACRBN8_20065 [Nannocystales bacterium]